MNYFEQNQDEMQRVIETEVDVSVEKEGYILVGRIDLLLGGDGKLELLDFKSSERPTNSPLLIAEYERQLCTYAHILEQRYGKRPDRLLLYWTGEARKADALMEFPYRPELVDAAGLHFDSVVGKIRAGDFVVLAPPEAKICKECDLRRYCVQDGLIKGDIIQGEDGGSPPAFNGGCHADELVPAGIKLTQRHILFNGAFQDGGHGEFARNMQTPVPQMAQARTEIEAEQLADRHAKIGIAVCVNREPFDVGDRGLSDHPFDRRARLPLMQDKGLVVDNAPLIQDMRIDAHRVLRPAAHGPEPDDCRRCTL